MAKANSLVVTIAHLGYTRHGIAIKFYLEQ
jgi:hypothetical protein